MFSKSLWVQACVPGWWAQVRFEQLHGQRQLGHLPPPFHQKLWNTWSCSKAAWKFSTNPCKVFAYAIACVVCVFITRYQSVALLGTRPPFHISFEQPCLKAGSVRCSVTSGKRHGSENEATRAGGREQPPAEDARFSVQPPALPQLTENY